MKLVVSALVSAITIVHAQNPSKLTTTTLDSSWLDGARNYFETDSKQSPQLPTLPPPTLAPTSSSSSSEDSVGLSISNSEASAGASDANDETLSVASSDEDYSVEYDPSSSNDTIVVSSDSGSGMFMNDDTSASINSEAGSGGISTRSIAFFMSASMATIVINALTLS